MTTDAPPFEVPDPARRLLARAGLVPTVQSSGEKEPALVDLCWHSRVPVVIYVPKARFGSGFPVSRGDWI